MNRGLLEKLDDIMDMLHLMEDNQVMIFQEVMRLREKIERVENKEEHQK